MTARDLFEVGNLHAEAWSDIVQDAKRLHAEMDATFPPFVRQRWEDLTEPAREAFLERAFEAIKAG